MSLSLCPICYFTTATVQGTSRAIFWNVLPHTRSQIFEWPFLILLLLFLHKQESSFFLLTSWIPVFTGMTTLMLCCTDARGRSHSNAMRYRSPRIGRPSRKVCTAPQGEGFPPSPIGTLMSVVNLFRAECNCHPTLFNNRVMESSHCLECLPDLRFRGYLIEVSRHGAHRNPRFFEDPGEFPEP